MLYTHVPARSGEPENPSGQRGVEELPRPSGGAPRIRHTETAAHLDVPPLTATPSPGIELVVAVAVNVVVASMP